MLKADSDNRMAEHGSHYSISPKASPALSTISSFEEASQYLTSQIPHFDFVVSHSQLFLDSIKLVELLFPAWNPDDLDLEQCKDGITNKCTSQVDFGMYMFLVVVKCRNNGTSETVLIRAYGKKSELVIDRHQELVVL